MPPKRDKDKPKGKTSAYAFFVQEQKEHSKTMGEKLDFTSLSKACSEKWKTVSSQDKSKYVKMAEADKIRWEREMKDYVPPPEMKDAKRKKKKKDANAPKRALSGFMFFSQEKRPNVKSECPNASVGEVAKQLGSIWKLMTPEQKQPYEEMAKADRERYVQERERYKESGGGASVKPVKKSPQKRGRKPKKAVVEEEIDEDDEEDMEEEDDEDEDSSD